MTPTTERQARERADLLESLAQQRWFLRFTANDLSDDQATTRTTASTLTIGGVIRHVAETEAQWVAFVQEGPAAFASDAAEWSDAETAAAWTDRFAVPAGVTLAAILQEYDRVAEHTAQVLGELPDLDADHPLPEAPWFEPGARWSARRVLLHVIAETSQHAGHADIIRESLDGQKTMG